MVPGSLNTPQAETEFQYTTSCETVRHDVRNSVSGMQQLIARQMPTEYTKVDKRNVFLNAPSDAEKNAALVWPLIAALEFAATPEAKEIKELIDRLRLEKTAH